MKKIIFSSIILLAVALITPKFTGNYFNSNLDKVVELIDSQAFYSAEIVQREQNWFTTKAQIKVSMSMDAMDPNQTLNLAYEDMSITVPLDAQHGPVILQHGFGLAWSSFAVKVAKPQELVDTGLESSLEHIYQVIGKVSLLGNLHYEDTIAALKFVEENDNAMVQTSQWNGYGTASKSSISYTGKGFDINVTEDDSEIVTLEGLSLEFDLQAGLFEIYQNLLYDGELEFTFNKLMIHEPSEEKITIEGAHMAYVSVYDEAEELADFQMTLGSKAFSTGGLLIDDVEFSYYVNNIGKALAESYMALIEAPEDGETIVQNYIQNELLSQLQTEPEFGLSSIKASINDSKLEGYVNSKIQGVTQLPVSINDLAFWLQHLVVDGKLDVEEDAALFISTIMIENQLAGHPQFSSMDEAEFNEFVLQQSQATIEGMQQQGMLVKTDTGYQLVFTMQDGQASLNGQAMPLPL